MVRAAITSVTLLAATLASACTGPSVNEATVELIASFESFSPDIYTDAAGYPTVGYGHLCQEDGCAEVPYPIPLSESDGEALLADDLAPPQDCITTDTGSNVVLNANQYGALVSWAFNVGCGNAASSSLIRRLNAGEDPSTVIEEELPKWNKAGGQVLQGLVRRRAAEVDLADTYTDDPALPAGC
ncbi:lysozyme [Xylariaceae sp. FL0594]|nr:lysozyme [Xylariaceae sp. FL0594]